MVGLEQLEAGRRFKLELERDLRLAVGELARLRGFDQQVHHGDGLDAVVERLECTGVLRAHLELHHPVHKEADPVVADVVFAYDHDKPAHHLLRRCESRMRIRPACTSYSHA